MGQEREIKFRVWDNVDWMSSPFTFSDIQSGKIGFTHGLPVMQFTGLKDKNGKEIYEADFDTDYNVVKWCDKRCGWSLYVYDFPTKDFIFCNCYNCEGNFEITEGEIEIIGNIYENKNLLHGTGNK